VDIIATANTLIVSSLALLVILGGGLLESKFLWAIFGRLGVKKRKAASLVVIGIVYAIATAITCTLLGWGIFPFRQQELAVIGMFVAIITLASMVAAIRINSLTHRLERRLFYLGPLAHRPLKEVSELGNTPGTIDPDY